jgi:hypothetical protein
MSKYLLETASVVESAEIASGTSGLVDELLVRSMGGDWATECSFELTGGPLNSRWNQSPRDAHFNGLPEAVSPGHSHPGDFDGRDICVRMSM